MNERIRWQWLDEGFGVTAGLTVLVVAGVVYVGAVEILIV